MAIEAGGVFWRPGPGATASAEEFLQARSLIAKVHQALRWNPWLLEDRADELAAAEEVCAQWTRAEPDYRPAALEDREAGYEQRMAEVEARFAAQEAQAERERAGRAAGYDPERAQARLALLEQRAVQADHLAERQEMTGRQGDAGVAGKRHLAQLARLDKTIAELETEIGRLGSIVGDEETVADPSGWLPGERREWSLVLFAAQRVREVRELRRRVTARREKFSTASNHAGRAAIREALQRDTARLAYLEAIPPMTAAQMCSECPWPAGWRAVGTTYGLAGQGELSGPCDGWPQWGGQRRKLIQQLAERQGRPASPSPPPPQSQPLAVIPSGLPIEEMIAKLAAIQAEHPGAQVRQGARRRWEIWPPVKPTAKPA
ncbi:MAG: hypothetical protein ACRDPY_01120 [Streptosporangiaceae bacterium]